MKKLDAGYWMLILGIIVFAIANLGGIFLAETILPANLQGYSSLFVHLMEGFACFIFALIFGGILANSANRGAEYRQPEECQQDINSDVRATIFMVIITTLIIGIPLGAIFAPTFFVPNYSVWGLISPHMKWSYSILVIFLITMCLLRNWERRITTRVCTRAMYNIDTQTLSRNSP